MEDLGSLVRVEDIRKVWDHEASDFTPWLADDENIGLLGETIGVELEVEAVEKNVGPFRADILCKDTETDSWVLIENQLERTDHKHLGQLLTYAAGLDAVTVVWIAERFTDEHRAALDWLNQITPQEFSFFGLEIELWQVGSSPMAPKFNVVSRPNEWTKTVSKISHGELIPTKEFYLEYWTGLKDFLEERNGVIKPVKPLPRYRLSFGLGFGIDFSEFRLDASASLRDKWICVSLTLRGPDANSHFHLLKQRRRDIEEKIGTELKWLGNPKKKRRSVRLFLYKTNIEDRGDWNRQHQWLCEQLEAFHNAFSERVQRLDASEYLPEEDETDA